MSLSQPHIALRGAARCHSAWLCGVQLAVSGDRAGLKRAIREEPPEVTWQRCCLHFLRNALVVCPRKADDDCLMKLRWLYDRRNARQARRDPAAWLGRWAGQYPKLCSWVDEIRERSASSYSVPKATGT